MAEDYNYAVKIFAKNPKSAFINTPLIAYRQSSNSASHQKLSYNAIDSHISLLVDCMNILQSYEPHEDVVSLQKRIIPVVYRYTCTYPYFRAYKECEEYWAHYLPICKKLVKDGYEDKLMLSNDMGKKSHHTVYGYGPGYEYIHDKFLPRLLDEGFKEEVVHKFMYENPARFYAMYK